MEKKIMALVTGYTPKKPHPSDFLLGCVSHHHACECRERHFQQMEIQLKNAKTLIQLFDTILREYRLIGSAFKSETQIRTEFRTKLKRRIQKNQNKRNLAGKTRKRKKK